MNFTCYKLAEIATIQSGKRLPKGHKLCSEPTPYRYIQGRDIKNGRVNTLNLPYITEDTKSKISKYIVNTGDVLITVVANIGDVGYVTEDLDGVNLTENAIRLTNYKDFVFPKYLSYLLATPLYKGYMEGLAAGAAQAKLGIYKVKKINVALPALNLQKKIVSLLDSFEDLIEVNRRRIAILEEMAMRTYREWFVFFRFPGHETTEFVNGLPKGWEYKQLEDIIKFDRGCSYTSEDIDVDEGVKLINLKNIKSYGGYNYDGLKLFAGSYKPRHIVRKGDLVMGVTDMTQDRRTVGSVALIPDYNETSIISTDLVKIKSKLPNIFLYAMFRFGGYSKFISEFANGSNVLHLKPTAIRRQLLPIPTYSFIQQFDNIIAPIVDEMEVLTRQISQLQQMRNRLLPQLMSGQLEVIP